MKNEIRISLLKKRRALSQEEVMKKSKEIQKLLFGMQEYKKAQKILYYISYDNEVNTHEMIKESVSQGKTVVVPKTDKKQHKLMLSELVCWDDLECGTYNILEPKKECIKEIHHEVIDLLIVPGVVFDFRGNRIGHGMGYYDKLLCHCICKPKIGLAFDFQIVDQVPIEKHDVRVDKIVTEKRIISCED